MGDHFPLPSGPPLDPFFVASMKHRDGRTASPDEQHDAAQLGVASDGPDYTFNGYRYQELDDAIAYARIARSRPDGGAGDRGPGLQRIRAAGPTAHEREVMATHGIQFDGRAYLYAGFRYDCLIDAINQVRRMGAMS